MRKFEPYGLPAFIALMQSPEHLRVIHTSRRRERHGGVAVLAKVGRQDGPHVLACRGHAVVATEAIPSDPRVVETCRKPGGRTVTSVAVGLRDRMVGRLTLAEHVVVARRAAAIDRVMIHLRQWNPRRRPVTVVAHIRAQDVARGLRAGLNPAA